jgi:YggT family protein
VRADFRNPVAQAVVRITNPLILPMRRILPPIRKVDTASVLAVVIVATVKVAARYAMTAVVPLLPEQWVLAVAVELALALLNTYFYAILLYALLSMIAPGGYSPFQSILASLCEPVLRPIRRLIPPIAGIDLSPLWAVIAIQAILLLIPRVI